MSQEDTGSLARPRILLAGDSAARPEGLERALTRAGFQLVERDQALADGIADAVLITLKDIADAPLAALMGNPAAELTAAPVTMVLIASENRDAPAEVLALGATDALAAPIHLPELCVRLHARIRERKDLPSKPGPAAALFQASELENLDSRMRQELERARRYSLSFSLILLGVEELLGIEARDGSETAARLRDDVTRTLRRELRVPDFVVAYGQSEFAIVLPETGQTGARQSVIRIRDRLAAVPSEGDPRLARPRFSAGIVTYPHPAVSQADELLALAEAALMRGKAQAGERIGMAI